MQKSLIAALAVALLLTSASAETIPERAASCFAWQTHLGYLPVTGMLTVVAVVGALVQVWPRRRDGTAPATRSVVLAATATVATAGVCLAPIVVDQMFEVIRSLHALGMTILLVEQNLLAALEVATRGYVIETGKVTLQGSAAELSANTNIRAAYLGL